MNWTAIRVGDKFISIKNKPASTDKDCEPDPTTGVSTGPDFSKCKSYLSNSIALKAPGGVLELVSLSVSQPSRPPVFTSEPTLAVYAGHAVQPDHHGVRASSAADLCFQQ